MKQIFSVVKSYVIGPCNAISHGTNKGEAMARYAAEVERAEREELPVELSYVDRMADGKQYNKLTGIFCYGVLTYDRKGNPEYIASSGLYREK